MSRSPFTVNAVELLRQPGSRRSVAVTIALDDLGVDDPRLAGDVAVDVVAESTLDDIMATGTLEVAWRDSCRRCLRPLSDTLRIEVDERYALADQIVDPDAFPIDNGQLDLAPMVREGVLLGAPDAPLCRDDCPGLCPICGADLQISTCDCTTAVRDERWAALDQLRLDD